MHVIEIIVAAGQTFSHPNDQLHTMKTLVSLKAAITPDDDFHNSVKILQANAEELSDDHIRIMRQILRTNLNAASRRILEMHAELTRDRELTKGDQ